jgi:hypothetical protein
MYSIFKLIKWVVIFKRKYLRTHFVAGFGMEK